jgi:hypothetical protein
MTAGALLQGVDLLRALGGSRGASNLQHANSPGHAAFAGPNAPSFDQLLRSARSGSLSSGLPVKLAPGASVELSQEQLTRLAQAADLAESRGVSRGVFLIDGMALTMDVPVRTITGRVDASPTGVLDGIDAVVNVAPSSGSLANGARQTPGAPHGATHAQGPAVFSALPASILPPPASLAGGNANASLLRMLAGAA